MNRYTLALVLTLAGGPALADEATDKADAIIDRAEAQAEGYGDVQATAEMIIRNGRGSEARRELRIAILEMPGKASRSLTVVEAPRDVEGTALLTHTDTEGETDQWLYLPALSRVKRIASSGRSGPFMGSQFTFEDFSAQPPENYRFRWLRDEACGELTCHVLRRWPKAGVTSAYDHQIVWMDTDHLRLQKTEFYDSHDKLMKTMTVDNYSQYEGQYWRAERFVMANARTDAETVLAWSDIEIGVGLYERDFDVNALKAAR